MTLITVVGSVNLDLVARAPVLPRPGETITDATFERHPGGKGANQALAARRMGAEVRLIGCIGDDSEAIAATRLVRDAGVDLSRTRTVPDAHTGIALIVVDADGQNQIVVAPGANRTLAPDDVELSDTDVVICQLEIPVDVVARAVEQAPFSVLNCAPARPLPEGLLANCDVVVVNETERAFYGAALDDAAVVIVTLGAEGAAAFRKGTEVARVPSLRVEAIDTVGAGDTFVGTLAVELASGRALDTAMGMAAAAGAVATTRPGAQPAIPTRAEVTARMQEEDR
ncbi:MAG: ribokinase [Acidimicrobiia bacterium]